MRISCDCCRLAAVGEYHLPPPAGKQSPSRLHPPHPPDSAATICELLDRDGFHILAACATLLGRLEEEKPHAALLEHPESCSLQDDELRGQLALQLIRVWPAQHRAQHRHEIALVYRFVVADG